MLFISHLTFFQVYLCNAFQCQGEKLAFGYLYSSRVKNRTNYMSENVITLICIQFTFITSASTIYLACPQNSF